MGGDSAWHALGQAHHPVPVSPPQVLHGRPAPDLVVVGLGLSGLEAARAAARRGADVVALDAVGVAAGAAGANGGLLLAGLARFHHEAVAALGRGAAVAWYRRTLAELDRLGEEEPTFQRVGSLRTAADAEEETDIAAHLAALRADGLGGEAYGGHQGRGLFVPGDGIFHPVARCRRLAADALAAGATLVAPARVNGVVPGEVRVAAVARPLVAPRALVAVDGGLERLVPSLDGRVRTARLQMLATASVDEVVIDRPVYHRGGLDYVQQRPSGEVLLGGGRDVGGDGEWGAPAEPSAEVQHHLERWLRALGVVAPVTQRWAAHAAFTVDRLPVDRRIGEGLHVVGAYSGHGNVLGGLLAREAALALLDG